MGRPCDPEPDCPELEDGAPADLDPASQAIAAQLPALIEHLRAHVGRDFSGYKQGTLVRRVQKRMVDLQVASIDDYAALLRVSGEEGKRLLDALLIGVTRFFRDPEAFEALRSRIAPALLAQVEPGRPLRVWVPGCATGEEVYSVAILLCELLWADGRRGPTPLKLFGTDIDETALEIARAGAYREAAGADITPARLSAFFRRENGRLRIDEAVRELCLFSTQDVTRDPPFSRLDLVCCRNLLIYFEPQLQQRSLATFHYALRPGGALMLGPSENAGQSPLFEAVDKPQRLYWRRETAASYSGPMTAFLEGAEQRVRRAPSQAGEDLDRKAMRALAPYTPAFFVVDGRGDVLRFSARSSRFLEPNAQASLNLLRLLHNDLRAVVRTALAELAERRAAVVREDVPFGAHGADELLDVIVAPLGEAAEALSVVALRSVRPRPAWAASAGAAPDRETAALLRELAGVRERLRRASDELSAAHEQLQSSDEEYLSVNEELQSTNEELETSKEELQSLNEELQTINAELTARNEALTQLNADLNNLIDSTSTATLFLDGELRVRRFTPRITELFALRKGDEGRPIADITTRLVDEKWIDDSRRVLLELLPVERTVVLREGADRMLQVRPYLSMSGVVDGIVLTFSDLPHVASTSPQH